MNCVPLTVPGGNPITEVPGERPRFPLSKVGPVFVIVVPANVAKPEVVPKAQGKVPEGGPDGTLQPDVGVTAELSNSTWRLSIPTCNIRLNGPALLRLTVTLQVAPLANVVPQVLAVMVTSEFGNESLFLMRI